MCGLCPSLLGVGVSSCHPHIPGIFQGSQAAALIFVNKVLANVVLWPFGDWKFQSLRLQLGSRLAAEMSTAQSVVHGGVTPVQRKEEASSFQTSQAWLSLSQMWPQRSHFACLCNLSFLICEMVLF